MTRFEKQQTEYMESRDKTVVKANELIRKARYDLPIGQQRILQLLISEVATTDKEFSPVKLSIASFCRVCGMKNPGGNTYSEVKRQIEGLFGAGFWMDAKGGTREHLYRWINEPEMDKNASGFVYLQLSDSLKPFLLELRDNFTKYEWIYTARFRHKYSLRLYDLIKSVYYDKSKPYSFVFQLDDLRAELGAETYTEFKDFKKRVLRPSIEEINEYSDLIVYDYETLTTGRTVKGIKLRFEIKETVDLIFLREEIDKALGTNQISIWERMADAIRGNQDYAIVSDGGK